MSIVMWDAAGHTFARQGHFAKGPIGRVQTIADEFVASSRGHMVPLTLKIKDKVREHDGAKEVRPSGPI